MVHSGYGQEQYPEPHLSAIAHAGMNEVRTIVIKQIVYQSLFFVLYYFLLIS